MWALLWLLPALLFLARGSAAETVDQMPQPQDYVSDFAHVLSPGTVVRLDRICSELDHGKAHAQLAVVIVNNLGGDDAADFANRLEERWKVGKKGSDRGVLMLLSAQDHKYWIEVGYGLEGILPDGKVGDIGRSMVPYLRTSDYDAAVLTGTSEIAQVIRVDAKDQTADQTAGQADNADAAQQQAIAAHRRHRVSVLGLVLRLLFLLLILGFLGSRGILGLFLGMMLGGGFGGGGGGGGGFGGGDSGFGGFGGGESGGGGAGGSW